MLINLASRLPARTLRKLRTLSIVIIIVFLLSLAQKILFQIGQITPTDGSATITRQSKSQTISTTNKLFKGDSIKVAPYAEAEIVLKGNTVLRLESGTEMRIEDIKFTGNSLKSAKIKLIKGKIWTNLGTISKDTQYIVQTDNSQIRSSVGSMNVTRRVLRSTEYYVHHGTGEVTVPTSEDSRIVSQGQSLIVHDINPLASLTIGSSQPPDRFINGWIRTNFTKDDSICVDNPQTPGCDPAIYTPGPTSVPTPAPVLSEPISTEKPKSKGEIIELSLTADPNSSPGQQAVVKVIAHFNSGQYEDITHIVAWQQQPELGQFTKDRFLPSKAGTVKIMAHYNMRQSNEVEIIIHPSQE